MINAKPKGLRIRPSNIFYGWWIVAISTVTDALKHGTFNRGISFYVLPVSRDLGVGVAAISFAEMLGRLEGGILGPPTGYLTDRIGPRAMLAFGGLASGLGFILLSFTHSYIYFVLIFVGLMSVGFRSGYNNATVPALNQWFNRRRALAMSVASTGNGIGGLVLAPVVGVLVLTLGWQNAAIVSGIIILAVVVPLSIMVRRSPESMGLLPDGAPARSEPPPSTASLIQTSDAKPDPTSTMASARRPWSDADFTAKEAMRTASYWLLVLAVGLRNTVHSGMSFLLVPVMVWFLEGGGRSEASSQAIAVPLVGVFSLGTIVFNPLVGWAGDNWSKQRLSAVAMVAGALALSIIVDRDGALWRLAVFTFLLAFSETANPLAWAIMGDFFGRRSFATLRGWQHLPDQLMSMSTPVWMGLVVDNTGSYKWALIPLIVIYVLSAFFHWIIPRPKVPVRPPSGPVPDDR
ncbi:MAG: hypothetical protein BZY88_18920 [SAR202 cluster bacterium Io17-Chloro-G9]|nr:MAG: hypothetical protein BZY88_18920 [SAR202 cluster bacterium Io17-Chloro-G9]